MNYIERSVDEKKSDIRRAMNYSYLKFRMSNQRFNSFVHRLFFGSVLFFMWVFVLALLLGAFS